MLKFRRSIGARIGKFKDIDHNEEFTYEKRSYNQFRSNILSKMFSRKFQLNDETQNL